MEYSRYNVKEDYKGNNEKILHIIDIWESMSYKEKHEIFCLLDEWNHDGT